MILGIDICLLMKPPFICKQQRVGYIRTTKLGACQHTNFKRGFYLRHMTWTFGFPKEGPDMHGDIRSWEKSRKSRLAIPAEHPRRGMTKVLTMSALLCTLCLERGHL